jgi:FkbM family methyltransferase
MSLPDGLLSSRFSLEHGCRQRWQVATLGDGLGLCRVLGKFLFFVDLQDRSIAPHLMLDGFWEAWITLAVARRVRPGWHCVDLGSNHGYYAVLMADLAGPGGKVLAVEPNSRLVSLLAQTSEVNGLQDRLQILEGLAWQASGLELDFRVPSGRCMNASIFSATGSAHRQKTVAVDDLTQDWPRVDLIKIDVEGAEVAVWQGMERTLRRHGEVAVLMEINVRRYGAEAEEFLRSLSARFPVLRHVDYDGDIRPVSSGQILDGAHRDWMLWLERTS